MIGTLADTDAPRSADVSLVITNALWFTYIKNLLRRQLEQSRPSFLQVNRGERVGLPDLRSNWSI